MSIVFDLQFFKIRKNKDILQYAIVADEISDYVVLVYSSI